MLLVLIWMSIDPTESLKDRKKGPVDWGFEFEALKIHVNKALDH